jgi:hypothetical protein
VSDDREITVDEFRRRARKCVGPDRVSLWYDRNKKQWVVAEFTDGKGPHKPHSKLVPGYVRPEREWGRGATMEEAIARAERRKRD